VVIISECVVKTEAVIHELPLAWKSGLETSLRRKYNLRLAPQNDFVTGGIIIASEMAMRLDGLANPSPSCGGVSYKVVVQDICLGSLGIGNGRKNINHLL
jgi:hypothetical protein